MKYFISILIPTLLTFSVATTTFANGIDNTATQSITQSELGGDSVNIDSYKEVSSDLNKVNSTVSDFKEVSGSLNSYISSDNNLIQSQPTTENTTESDLNEDDGKSIYEKLIEEQIEKENEIKELVPDPDPYGAIYDPSKESLNDYNPEPVPNISNRPEPNKKPSANLNPDINDYKNEDGFWVDKTQNNYVTHQEVSKEPPKIDVDKFNKTQWGVVSKGDRIQGAVTSNQTITLANRKDQYNANVITLSDRRVEFKPQQLKPLTTLTQIGITKYTPPTPNYTFAIIIFTVGILCIALSEYYGFMTRRNLKIEKENELRNGKGKYANLDTTDDVF